MVSGHARDLVRSRLPGAGEATPPAELLDHHPHPARRLQCVRCAAVLPDDLRSHSRGANVRNGSKADATLMAALGGKLTLAQTRRRPSCYDFVSISVPVRL